MSIQLERTLELRKGYTKKRNPPCNHEYDLEVFNGIHTGDYICKKCGHSISKKIFHTIKNQK